MQPGLISFQCPAYPSFHMPLSQTPTGVRASLTGQFCPKLPTGQQYFATEQPGGQPFACPHPCGQACHLMQGAAVAPPPLPRRLPLRLHLAPTLVRLVADALAHPCGSVGPAAALEPAGLEAGQVALVGRPWTCRN